VAKANPGQRPMAEGAGQWLKLPERIVAPSPEDRGVPCIFRLSDRDILKMARLGRRQLVFELWSVILGMPPPVPGCEHRNRRTAGELSRLNDAHALFQGIERPLAEDDDGGEVLAYVQKPHFLYEYDPDMVSVALKVPVPADLVFVTYARLDNASEGPRMARGTITHWGFVEADSSNPELPVNHSARYRKRLW
jgi:hypothetical protein